MLRMRFRWLVLLAGLLFVSPRLHAQTNTPPVIFTGPLSHPGYENGGFYTGFQFLAWSTNQPISYQQIAVRGFKAFDSSFGSRPGDFIGSGEEALNTNQVQGPSTFQPGWDLWIGYRFQGGVAVELNWKHLVQGTFHASAALTAPSGNNGTFLENTFLFAPVVNFGPAWAGANQNFAQGDVGATFGIWNAASQMSIEYTQRFDVYQINSRIPLWETADYRNYGLFGPRIAWVWDRFRWTTLSADQFGIVGPDTTAIYDNTVSNRMYGIHAGFGHDWWCGSTPIGGFSFSCDLEGALYFDFVKTSASYTRGDGAFSSGRNRRIYTLVPGVDGKIGFWYYPWEGIQIQLGYDIMTFFNTIASRTPIDFNLGAVDPQYDHQFLRYFYGINIGINFIW
jgi:hypothetical protein